MDHSLRNRRRFLPFELALAGALFLLLYSLAMLPGCTQPEPGADLRAPADLVSSWHCSKLTDAGWVPCPCFCINDLAGVDLAGGRP